MTDNVLSTGVRARLRPVPAYLIDAMLSEIEEPTPPKQYIKEKDRDEINPLDPDYLKAVEEINHRRGLITMKAMIMYGVELIDGVPDSDEWLPRLQWLEKSTPLDISEYDLENQFDLEFLYKSHIAVGNVDIMKITILSGMSNEEVAEAMRGFPGTETREPDREDADKQSAQSRDNDIP